MQYGGELSHRTGGRLDMIWQRVLVAAERDLGREAIEKWLSSITLSDVREDLAVLTASSQFSADWVERNFSLNLLRYLQAEQHDIPGLVKAVREYFEK